MSYVNVNLIILTSRMIFDPQINLCSNVIGSLMHVAAPKLLVLVIEKSKTVSLSYCNPKTAGFSDKNRK